MNDAMILFAIVYRGTIRIASMKMFPSIEALADFIKTNQAPGYRDAPSIDGCILNSWAAWWVHDGRQKIEPQRISRADRKLVGLP